MNYSVELEGLKVRVLKCSRLLWPAPGCWSMGDGRSAGPKRGQMTLRRNDGREVIAAWKPQMLGLDVPQLVVDGKTISLVEPLQWYEWVWSGLPILLVFLGGLLGGLAGAVAFAVKTKVFRSPIGSFAKFALTGIVSVTAVAAYVIATMILLTAIGR